MGARERLNSIAVTTCLFLAGVVGLLAQSFTAFLIAFAVFLAMHLHTGELRPRWWGHSSAPGTKRRRRPRRRRRH